MELELIALNMTYFVNQVPVENRRQQESNQLISDKPEGQQQPPEALMEHRVQRSDRLLQNQNHRERMYFSLQKWKKN